MAASGQHLGHYLYKNSRFLLNNVQRLWLRRTFCSTSVLRQQTAEADEESTEPVIIPKKKTWSKEAVLEALAATVNKDPTAHPYQYQDDPFLCPKNTYECDAFSVAQHSGSAAARYFINNNPKLFAKDFAEPHIPCLMPESVSLCIDAVSEEALKERIKLRRVRNAVDMYDQLLQAGTVVSMETAHDLLDLICLYCDKDPVQDGEPQAEDREDSSEEVHKRNERGRQASNHMKLTWRENNNAERIFNLLPERDARCYSALIRGMVKYGAHSKAFSMYTDMLNNRLIGDVHTFNALISAIPRIADNFVGKRGLIIELFKQMSQQNVKPNLLTFNNAIRALRSCGSSPQTEVQARETFSEMRAVGIVPSLATFDHMLAIFNQCGSELRKSSEVLRDMLSEIEGRSFSCQDPCDVSFFSNAMKVCLKNKDLELAYKVQELVDVGENWRFLGNRRQSSSYYGLFFSLLCMREHIDVVLKWYRQHTPSVYYPTSYGLGELMAALDADSRLDLLPSVWADVLLVGHSDKINLVEELLHLMARDEHSPEVQESFAECALDVMRVFEGSIGKFILNWTNSSLINITLLLLRANKTQQAWAMLPLFKANNLVPSEQLMEECLSACQSAASADRAVEVVQLSAAFCLSVTPRLAQRTLTDFKLTEDQRAVLAELESAEELKE